MTRAGDVSGGWGEPPESAPRMDTVERLAPTVNAEPTLLNEVPRPAEQGSFVRQLSLLFGRLLFVLVELRRRGRHSGASRVLRLLSSYCSWDVLQVDCASNYPADRTRRADRQIDMPLARATRPPPPIASASAPARVSSCPLIPRLLSKARLLARKQLAVGRVHRRRRSYSAAILSVIIRGPLGDVLQYSTRGVAWARCQAKQSNLIFYSHHPRGSPVTGS